jgi:hypothetical protein
MPVVMKQMHQWARGQQRKREKPDDMRAVFREQKVRPDRQKAEEDESRNCA